MYFFEFRIEPFNRPSYMDNQEPNIKFHHFFKLSNYSIATSCIKTFHAQELF